jgi:DNA-binding NtrC family response regulator
LLMHPQAACSMRPDAIRTGVTDFLLQPVDLMELAARASNLLALRQARLALSEHKWRGEAAISDPVARNDTPSDQHKQVLFH